MTPTHMFRLDTSRWHIVRVVFLIAGTLTIISAALAITLDIRWLALTALVGLMQIIFSTTGFCPAAIILDRLGLPRA